MAKFTDAIEIGGFIQALRDNGEIFILGTKPSDEFGMRMDDSTISLMGKTREGIKTNLQQNSDPNLVDKVNTAKAYQKQVENYEKYVDPNRYKRKESNVPKETAGLTKKTHPDVTPKKRKIEGVIPSL